MIRSPYITRRRTALAVGVVLVIAATAVYLSSSASCAPINGGTPDAQAQLRYVDADDQHVTFTFGRSAGRNTFAVPRFVLEPVATPTDGDGKETFAIRFTGVSIVNPDGSPSYFGSTAFLVGRDGITRLALLGDSDRNMEWRLALSRAGCPKVAEETYTMALTPRAQLVVSLGDLRTLTAEPALRPAGGTTGTGYMGNSPTMVTGRGFPANSQVTISLGQRTLTETTANAAGTFQVGAYIPPDLTPGIYTITARDSGGSATAPFTVTLPAKPLDLQD